MTEDILAQFMDPKKVVVGHHGLMPEDDAGELRDQVGGVIPASQPVVEITEQERRQQEVQEYLDSLKPTPTMSAERIEEIRQQVLATVPMANGIPIPESGTLTQEQMRNNPSNYQPAIEPYLEQAAVSSDTIVIGVHVEDTVAPPENQQGGAFAAAARVAAPVVAPEPQPVDERQQWICVGSDGIRTLDSAGAVHPAFRSDAHLLDNMVQCPTCKSFSVRKVMPDEDLKQSRQAAKWMYARTQVMGLNPNLEALQRQRGWTEDTPADAARDA
jgi:hypothetical protein